MRMNGVSLGSAFVIAVALLMVVSGVPSALRVPFGSGTSAVSNGLRPVLGISGAPPAEPAPASGNLPSTPIGSGPVSGSPVPTSPHPGTLAAFAPGYPASVDPQVDDDLSGLGPIENVYQTLVSFNGSSTSSLVPTLATCVPGTPQCLSDYGTLLTASGTGALAGQTVYWTFVIDPAARFYDPASGASWGVYPSDVMFSIARDLLWSDPGFAEGLTPGWTLAYALLPSGTTLWDGADHYPFNNTPANILGSMLVNDSRFCPRSGGAFVGHGCITFVANGSGDAWPFFLDLVAEPLGASIVPCGWFTAQSAGLPGWNGTAVSNGDGSCRLPDGGTTTNSTEWTNYLASLSPKAWDSLEELIRTTRAPQPEVQFRMVGSGPYFESFLNASLGYALRASPAYEAPSGCVGAGSLAPYVGVCDPDPGTFIPSVEVSWEPPKLQWGLSAALNNSADFAPVASANASSWVDLADAGNINLLEIPAEETMELNFNLDWNSTAFYSLGYGDDIANIPANFFAGTAARSMFAAAFPYAAAENSLFTVDGLQFGVPTGGPIPRNMPPYSTAVYPPTGNVSFPNGTPDLYNASVVGSAAWWWQQGTDEGGRFFDPELLNCTFEESGCRFPIFAWASDPNFVQAAEMLSQSVSAATDDAVIPYELNVTEGQLVTNLTDPPGTVPFPLYEMGWIADYPDPTDVMPPYASPNGTFTSPDAVAPMLGLPVYDAPDTCPDTGPTFANLSFWAMTTPVDACQGVAYSVALAWINITAGLPFGAARTQDYDLISQILNNLALYIWVDQPNSVVAVAPWLNVSSVDTNPGIGGGDDQLWFELRYLSPSTSPALPSVSVGQAPETPMYDPQNGEIYVPDTASSTVTVLSGSNHQLLTNISVGADPQTPVLDSANGQIYVANFGSNNVTVINATINVVNTTIPVGVGPTMPTYDSATGELFVANNGSDNVSAIAGATNSVNATLPVGVEPGTAVLDRDNGELYVPNYGSDNVSVINASLLRLVTTVAVGSGPEPGVYDPANGNIYVPDFLSGNVSVISGQTNTVIATIAVGSEPFSPRGSSPLIYFSRTTLPRGGPVFDPSNQEVYVTDVGAATVSAISGSTEQVVATIPVGLDPQSPVYDPRDSHLYVANSGSGNLSVISGSTNAVIASIPTGPEPSPPVLDNASGGLYVPNTGSNNVTVVASSFYITFQATGLPTGASWRLAVSAVPTTSNGYFHRTTVPVAEPNGTVSYVIAGPAGYRVAAPFAPAGELTVAGTDLLETVHFVRAPTYSVTLHESGLPTAALPLWCATLGWSVCDPPTSITFANLTPGQYSFSVTPVAGFRLSIGHGSGGASSPPVGQVNVTTHSVSVRARFVPVVYPLSFTETGLVPGTAWSVHLRYLYYGKTITRSIRTKGSVLTIDVPNGTFSYTVATVKGYTSLSSGTVSVDGSGPSASVVFVPVTHHGAAPVGSEVVRGSDAPLAVPVERSRPTASGVHRPNRR